MQKCYIHKTAAVYAVARYNPFWGNWRLEITCRHTGKKETDCFRTASEAMRRARIVSDTETTLHEIKLEKRKEREK